MKDSILNEIQTLWVYCYVIWVEECISNILKNDQWYDLQILRQLCNDVFKWHSHILKDTERAQKTCKSNNKSSTEVSVVY